MEKTWILKESLFSSPFKATGVESYLHSYSTSCIEITSLNGDSGSPRQRPSRRTDTSEVWRLRRDIGKGSHMAAGLHWGHQVVKKCPAVFESVTCVETQTLTTKVNALVEIAL